MPKLTSSLTCKGCGKPIARGESVVLQTVSEKRKSPEADAMPEFSGVYHPDCFEPAEKG